MDTCKRLADKRCKERCARYKYFYVTKAAALARGQYSYDMCISRCQEKYYSRCTEETNTISTNAALENNEQKI